MALTVVKSPGQGELQEQKYSRRENEPRVWGAQDSNMCW